MIIKQDSLYRIIGEREIDREIINTGERRIRLPYSKLFKSLGPFKDLAGEERIFDITPSRTGAMSISTRISDYEKRIRVFLPKIFLNGKYCIVHGREGLYQGHVALDIPVELVDKNKSRIARYDSAKRGLASVIRKRVKEKSHYPYLKFKRNVEDLIKGISSNDVDLILKELSAKFNIGDLWCINQSRGQELHNYMRGTLREFLPLLMMPKRTERYDPYDHVIW